MKVELLAVTPDAERVVEEAGRTCYMSFDRMREGSEGVFIKNLLRAGHLSVLEHASATFRVSGASRAFTHQLVRHRMCSFSQQSQRYVSEKGFRYTVPPSIESGSDSMDVYRDAMNYLAGAYGKLLEMGIRKEDARYVLPNACRSEIVFTANFRQLRHMIGLRGEKKAQWEIREVFIEILKCLKSAAPACFYDFNIDETERVIKIKEE